MKKHISFRNNQSRIIQKLNQAENKLSAIGNNESTRRRMKKEIIYADAQIKKLDEIQVENPSALVKYRRNISVPAAWVPEQGFRVANIPIIPASKVENIDKYIESSIKLIDGGDLDQP